MTPDEYAAHCRWKDVRISELAHEAQGWVRILDAPVGYNAMERLKWLQRDLEAALIRCTAEPVTSDTEKGETGQPTVGCAPVCATSNVVTVPRTPGTKTPRSGDATK